MIYKNFYLQLIGRIILISINAFWLGLALQNTNLVYTIIVALGILILQTIAFVQYFNRTNRNLANYFSSLLSKDFSQSLKKQPIKSLTNLTLITNGIKDLIKSSVIEKENHYHYLQHVISHIETSLISANSEGKILLINDAAKRLFDLPRNIQIFNTKNLPSTALSILKQIKVGEQLNISIYRNKEKLPLLVRKSSFILDEQEIFVITFQNIKNEMEEKELESWQKLISILSHEIMNSMTPITTLTHAIKKSIEIDAQESGQKGINNSILEDIVSNTQIIEKRSLGLIEFVNKYRNLTKVKTINVEKFSVQNLFEDLIVLFKPELNQKNINLKFDIKEDNFEILADYKLIEQVLINLIKNASEAFIEKTGNTIQLVAFRDNSSDYIEVIDNGSGISDEKIDQIFIPFFTTKQNGSGIGLSLSRQIMRLHKGEIQVESDQKSGCTFRLKF